MVLCCYGQELKSPEMQDGLEKKRKGKKKRRRKSNMFSYLTESKAKKPRWGYSDLRSVIQEGRKGNKHFNQTDIKTAVNCKYILEDKNMQKVKSVKFKNRLLRQFTDINGTWVQNFYLGFMSWVLILCITAQR